MGYGTKERNSSSNDPSRKQLIALLTTVVLGFSVTIGYSIYVGERIKSSVRDMRTTLKKSMEEFKDSQEEARKKWSVESDAYWRGVEEDRANTRENLGLPFKNSENSLEEKTD